MAALAFVEEPESVTTAQVDGWFSIWIKLVWIECLTGHMDVPTDFCITNTDRWCLGTDRFLAPRPSPPSPP